MDWCGIDALLLDYNQTTNSEESRLSGDNDTYAAAAYGALKHCEVMCRETVARLVNCTAFHTPAVYVFQFVDILHQLKEAVPVSIVRGTM